MLASCTKCKMYLKLRAFMYLVQRVIAGAANKSSDFCSSFASNSPDFNPIEKKSSLIKKRIRCSEKNHDNQ
ncbi:hypothetical protein BDZ91DRAFT_714287 [Kalaharituber pfeilii]|nr:hypothetical protein BDZ91DRAFT_714287 [Kalaharituber pfeilii]